MILCISTSSPQVSLALIYEGKVVDSVQELAPRTASKVVLELLEVLLHKNGLLKEHLTGVVADLGPGSFTGTRVGVMAAKTLAFARGIRCGGIDAFSLIGADSVVIRVRKGEWMRPDGEVICELPGGALTYGDGHENYPQAARLNGNLDRVVWSDPLAMTPNYILPPSISEPKQEILKKVIGS